jgi:hypothetical protein
MYPNVGYSRAVAKTARVNVRIPSAGAGWVAELATSLRVSRSEVVRAMMAVAVSHGDEVRRRVQQAKLAE